MPTSRFVYTDINEFITKFSRAMTRMQRQIRTPLRMSADWYMKNPLLTRFNQERTPQGHRWKALTPRTQRERTQLGYNPRHPILRRTGKLRGSFYRDFINQNTIKIDNRMVKAKKLHPKRPFLGFNRKDTKGVKDVFVRWSYNTLVKSL